MKQRYEWSRVLILPAMKFLKALLVLCDMHVFPITLRCTAIRKYLKLSPTLLVTHYTVSLYIRENWEVYCVKLSWRCRWFDIRIHRRDILRKITKLPYNLLPETCQWITWWLAKPFNIWKVDLMFSEKDKTIHNCNINEVEELCLPPSQALT